MRNRKLISYLVPLFISTGLIGCTTVGPDYTIPENATINKPEAAEPFAAAEENVYRQEPLPAHWWKLYDDPVLTSLIEKALVANTDLRVASPIWPGRVPCWKKSKWEQYRPSAFLPNRNSGAIRQRPTVSPNVIRTAGRTTAASTFPTSLTFSEKSPVVSKLPVPIPKRLRLPTIWPHNHCCRYGQSLCGCLFIRLPYRYRGTLRRTAETISRNNDTIDPRRSWNRHGHFPCQRPA